MIWMFNEDEHQLNAIMSKYLFKLRILTNFIRYQHYGRLINLQIDQLHKNTLLFISTMGAYRQVDFSSSDGFQIMVVHRMSRYWEVDF